MTNHLTKHTGNLCRFLLKQDRLRVPIWLISLFLVTVIVAISFSDLYPTKESRQILAETMRNPAMTAMVGTGYSLENYTLGAMMAHQMLLFTAIVVAIMSILFVTRHTRAEEEDGRMELIRSLPTGRLSSLLATLIMGLLINLILALVTGFGLAALHIESIDLNGSILYGAALGATGFFFTAITAIIAQLTESSRLATGFAFFILGLAYLLRAIGDVGNEVLSWLSPLGWILGSEVYVNNYWWPILLTVGAAFLLCLIALYLNTIRDMGAGFLPSRPGKRNASILLLSPFGLLFRLQRTAMISWGVGLFIIGAAYGSVLGDLEAFLADIDMIQQILTIEGFSLIEQFIPMLMSIMAMLSTVPVLMAMLKVIGEEKNNRMEHLLSRAVSRPILLGSSLAISMIVSLVMLSLSAFGLWAAGTSVVDGGLDIKVVFQAALIYLPAVWVMIGVAMLLIGISPKVTSWIWLYLIYSFIVVYLGNLIQFPEWMSKLSPYGYIPQFPIEDIEWFTIIILAGVSFVLMIFGFFGYKQRDMEG